MTVWLVATHTLSGEQEWFAMEAEPRLLGRPSAQDQPGKLLVSFDPTLSRRHFEAWIEGSNLHVRRIESKHPLRVEGVEREDFLVPPGGEFSTGQTRFRVSVGPEAPYVTFVLDRAAGTAPADPSRCLEALIRLQPLLGGSLEPEALLGQVLEILAEILPAAAALSALDLSQDPPRVLARRGSGPDRASRRLLAQAREAGKPVVFVWDGPLGQEPTATPGVRWAVAAPIEPGGVTLYAVGAGSGDEPGSLEQGVVALVAETLGHYLQGRRLHHREAQLLQFFSPALRTLIRAPEGEKLLGLERREATAFFFDLRGFSRAMEKAEKEESLWERYLAHHEQMRQIMTGVTGQIFEREGTVVDFQGDAVFACWGAPLAQVDHAERAVSSACSILEWLSRHHPEQKCGMGLASGKVLAGNVGVASMVRYQAAGRCVNLAARLEGLTKIFRVPVLLSGLAREQLDRSRLCRRIARIRPAGLDEPVDVFELVLPRELGGSGLHPAEVTGYEEALALYELGDLEAAEEGMGRLPVRDPVRRFLNHQIEHYLMHGRPEPWDGTIAFTQK